MDFIYFLNELVKSVFFVFGHLEFHFLEAPLAKVMSLLALCISAYYSLQNNSNSVRLDGVFLELQFLSLAADSHLD